MAKWNNFLFQINLQFDETYLVMGDMRDRNQDFKYLINLNNKIDVSILKSHTHFKNEKIGTAFFAVIFKISENLEILGFSLRK